MSNRSLIIGFVAGLVSGIILTGYAKASPPLAKIVEPERIITIASRVTGIFREFGYAVQDLPPPPVYSTRLYGLHGMTIDGVIVINSHAPAGCFNKIVAHELAHIILGRDLGLTPTASESEALAIELVIDPAYRPNCE